MQMPPFSKEVISSRTVSLAAVAFGFALAIAAVGYFLFSVGSAQVDGKDVTINFGPFPISLRAIVFGLFLLSFVVIWFLLYSQYSSEADDLYSRVRKKLIGNWKVVYEVEPGQQVAGGFERLGEIICRISLNPAQKLEINYDVSNNPLFPEGTQTIRAIGLTHDAGSKYWLTYYFKRNQTVSQKLSEVLLDDDGHKLTELEIEIFANLEFEDTLTKNPIMNFGGQWFDLNGNMIRLFALVAEFSKDDSQQQKYRLADAHIDRDNFAALMGKITFERIADAELVG